MSNNNNEISNPSRRGFLKWFGLGSLAIPASAALGKVGQSSNNSNTSTNLGAANNFLVKEWQEDGINFLEYELPPSVNAIFKKPGQKRAIYCPIKSLEEVYESCSYVKMLPVDKFGGEFHIFPTNDKVGANISEGETMRDYKSTADDLVIPKIVPQRTMPEILAAHKEMCKIHMSTTKESFRNVNYPRLKAKAFI